MVNLHLRYFRSSKDKDQATPLNLTDTVQLKLLTELNVTSEVHYFSSGSCCILQLGNTFAEFHIQELPRMATSHLNQGMWPSRNKIYEKPFFHNKFQCKTQLELNYKVHNEKKNVIDLFLSALTFMGQQW